MADSVRIKRIKFHYKGFNELRKAPAVRSELIRRANAIADAAGGFPDYDTDLKDMGSRSRAVVYTASAEAMASEASDRTLTRALDAGRG